MRRITTHWRNLGLLFLIVGIGAFFRLYNVNWDQNTHIHPDERFLTMVGNALRLPHSLASYFSPSLSTLNPVNVGYAFFVYGTVPLFINKFLAIALQADTYNDFTLLGRVLSAFADLIVLITIYKIGEIFERKYDLNSSVKFFAAFIYASLVLPMQLSHFFAVDTFLNCFSFLTFYCLLRFSEKENWLFYILSSFFFALAIGSKITVIYLLPLFLLLFIPTCKKWKTEIINKTFFLHPIARVCGFFLLTYLFLRIVYPYFFSNE
jgi:4-amino-4-deoxy-L-arabinose transferase-like glycosyltransferase